MVLEEGGLIAPGIGVLKGFGTALTGTEPPSIMEEGVKMPRPLTPGCTPLATPIGRGCTMGDMYCTVGVAWPIGCRTTIPPAPECIGTMAGRDSPPCKPAA